MSAIDDAYANAPYIPDGESFPDRWAEAAASFRVDLGARAMRHSYGDGARNWFDAFLPAKKPKGVLIFVHGGYWMKFDASLWSHLAAGAVAKGWAVAMPSYDLCPDVRIAEITQQIRAAVETIAEMFDGPISLAGHSAGGHLVARMLAPNMLSAQTLARLHHVAPISPVADLRPLLVTEMNRKFDMDMKDASAESPVLQPKPDKVVSVWVGKDERPAFLEQAKALAKAWECQRHVLPGKHHFDVIDALEDPKSPLIANLIA